MTDQPSRAVRLYGTEEVVIAPRLLRAGRLSVELEAGNLRYIRYAGVEVLRAVSFIVRDRDWGTYSPEISALEISEEEDRFLVTYRARASDAGQSFAYTARIEGRAEGTLTFEGRGAAETPFLTNRTGFVILHPVAGIAGAPVTVTHVDGRIVERHFPDLIDPVQPMMDLRALDHTTPEGLRARCLMEGDTYEMEDQRNWTDASYKTYVRPLALPWPYMLEPGSEIFQKISVRVSGEPEEAFADAALTARIGAITGRVPQLGMGLDPDDTKAAATRADLLKALGPAHLLCHHDPRRGHESAQLREQVDLAREIGAEPWLEAIVTEVEAFKEEVNGLGQKAAELGAPFGTVLLSPAPDLKSTLPGAVWPDAPDAAALAQAARVAFPGKRIGGGMFSYFTEFNRKRPPVEHLDLVSFTTSALVHAGDDRSVTETLQALPAVARSARAIAGELPLAVGPSAVGMRANPYGAAPKDNPGNIRQAMNYNDPRQRGLLGAAWALAYFAQFGQAGTQAVALGAPVGAFGAVHAPAAFPQPWYDEHGGVFPVYHVLRGIAGLNGRPLRRLALSSPATLQGFAAESDTGLEIWLANLTGDALSLEAPEGTAAVSRLDAAGFVEASRDPAFLDRFVRTSDPTLTLDAYAVLRILAEPEQTGGT
jgi:D-apionolactonase